MINFNAKKNFPFKLLFIKQNLNNLKLVLTEQNKTGSNDLKGSRIKNYNINYVIVINVK